MVAQNNQSEATTTVTLRGNGRSTFEITIPVDVARCLNLKLGDIIEVTIRTKKGDDNGLHRGAVLRDIQSSDEHATI